MGNTYKRSIANLYVILGIVAIISGVLWFSRTLSTLVLLGVLGLSIAVIMGDSKLKFDKTAAIVCLISSAVTILFGFVMVLRHDFFYYGYGVYSVVRVLFRIGLVANIGGGVFALITGSKMSKEIQVDTINQMKEERDAAMKRHEEEKETSDAKTEAQPEEIVKVDDEIHAKVEFATSQPTQTLSSELLDEKVEEVEVAQETVVEEAVVAEAQTISQEEATSSERDKVEEDVKAKDDELEKKRKDLAFWEERLIREKKMKDFKTIKTFYLILIILGIVSVIPFAMVFLDIFTVGFASIAVIVIAGLTISKMMKHKLSFAGPILTIVAQVFSLFVMFPFSLFTVFGAIATSTSSSRYNRYQYYEILDTIDRFGGVFAIVVALTTILAIVGVVMCFIERSKVVKLEQQYIFEDQNKDR